MSSSETPKRGRPRKHPLASPSSSSSSSSRRRGRPSRAEMDEQGSDAVFNPKNLTPIWEEVDEESPPQKQEAQGMYWLSHREGPPIRVGPRRRHTVEAFYEQRRAKDSMAWLPSYNKLAMADDWVEGVWPQPAEAVDMNAPSTSAAPPRALELWEPSVKSMLTSIAKVLMPACLKGLQEPHQAFKMPFRDEWRGTKKSQKRKKAAGNADPVKRVDTRLQCMVYSAARVAAKPSKFFVHPDGYLVVKMGKVLVQEPGMEKPKAVQVLEFAHRLVMWAMQEVPRDFARTKDEHDQDLAEVYSKAEAKAQLVKEKNGTAREVKLARKEYIQSHPVPPMAQVTHRCFNPKCLNVKHMEWASPKSNALDRLLRAKKL
jgi:hypothetical protein